MDSIDLDIVVGGASSVRNDVSDGVGMGVGGAGRKRVIRPQEKQAGSSQERTGRDLSDTVR